MFENKSINELFAKVQQAFETKKPFVVYRQPDSDFVKGFFQTNNDLYNTKDYLDSGFVFAPFDTALPSILFPISESQLYTAKFINTFFKDNQKDLSLVSNLESSKASHIVLVEDGIKFLEKNNYKKVVLSRKQAIPATEFNLVETFKKLLGSYNNALVYCWFHPKVGLWLGATPETLLKVHKNTFATMALAGTQVYIENKNSSIDDSDYNDVKWEAKEITEQKHVTDFILEQFEKSGVLNDFRVSKPYTTKAGNLLHLRTDISGELSPELTLKNIINLLHPTPAVCGVPKQEAKDFILQNENYNREFYTGFLGELNLAGTSNLYVNLRCMQLIKNTIEIYIGGGITNDSNPENEWEETVAKSKVMLKVL
ncbi:isochorismate synthase [Aureibaculum sp. A20]|uniref:isochorismate synthase n=1 Tax=Aureibaculum flavum TaxID=2795986 RepID=A0ABS0WTG9_9FLAO|nr:isochorismate synthase [Aureibaculum flavum]MBJ2175292.1 isochorismate synthase [Aureibaculum flavum]